MAELRDDDDFLPLLNNLAIVLVEPKYAENIGAAARSAMNMGISRLIVVAREEPDQEKMLKMATHHAKSLIDSMELHADLGSALEPFSFVVGTTARQGRQRRNIITPRHVVDKIIPLMADNQIAILFGPEHRGLTNDDLKYCNMTSTIPTTDFSSLNLAQAVAVHCYEVYYGLLQSRQGNLAPTRAKIASSREMEGMYEHLEEMLTRIDFLKNLDEYWMRSIRSFLGRIGLQSKEVKMIRGFCRQFLWYSANKGTSEENKPGESFIPE